MGLVAAATEGQWCGGNGDGVKKDSGGVKEEDKGVCGDNEGFVGVGSVISDDKGIDDKTKGGRRKNMVVRVYHNSIHMRLIQPLKDMMYGGGGPP